MLIDRIKRGRCGNKNNFQRFDVKKKKCDKMGDRKGVESMYSIP